jgi:hypothetical protein
MRREPICGGRRSVSAGVVARRVEREASVQRPVHRGEGPVEPIAVMCSPRAVHERRRLLRYLIPHALYPSAASIYTAAAFALSPHPSFTLCPLILYTLFPNSRAWLLPTAPVEIAVVEGELLAAAAVEATMAAAVASMVAAVADAEVTMADAAASTTAGDGDAATADAVGAVAAAAATVAATSSRLRLGRHGPSLRTHTRSPLCHKFLFTSLTVSSLVLLGRASLTLCLHIVFFSS